MTNEPVFGADKVVSGDGEDRLQEEGGPGGGVEGEGHQGAVDIVCTAVPGETAQLILTRNINIGREIFQDLIC